MFVVPVTISNLIFSQEIHADSLPQFKTVAAGKQHEATGLYRWFWGSNYRNLWMTPVTVSVLNMGSAYGGLTAYKADTNAAEKKLYLKNVEGKEYILTSVNKTPGKLLPAMLRNTYAENRVNDEVSITNPYAAATMPYLADAAKIYAPRPSYVYVPDQASLNTYNFGYGNDFYQLTEKANITDSANIIETYQLLEILKSNANIGIDKIAFIRERLFDMFVNDWNRGEGKWQWYETTENRKRIYAPLPKDRDAAYSKYDGKLLKLRFGVSGMNFIQSFSDDLKNVNTFNFKEKNIDRCLLNETTLNYWKAVAADLQQLLTDKVIEDAVQQLPKEIYPLTGNEIISKLKARRNHLVEWAEEYYKFLSKEVEIPGTYDSEEFNVQQTSDETTVNVFRLNNGERTDTPFYARTFKTSETKEIRLFGLAGEDKYIINGNNDNTVKIKIIDGINKDSLDVASMKKSNLIVYGNKNNIQTSAETQVKIHNDTSFKSYRYNWFTYDKKGFAPIVFYSHEDRLFVGLGYNMRHYTWGKAPFASNQSFNVHYSLMEQAFSVTYKTIFPKLVAKSDFTLFTNYDDVRWTYFFGLGNDTKFIKDYKIQYYTMRTRQWIVQPALVRTFGKNTISFFAGLNGIKVIDDTARFLSKAYNPDKSIYEWKTYADAGISYTFQQLNDAVVPTSGVYFNATASATQNIKTSSNYVFNYAGTAHFYIPLVSKFSLNIRAGAETVSGNPEFYQYASIGGTLLRGVVRDRFWGKTAFYNTNDLRFISPVHTRFFVGKAGLLAFIDNGRVWMPGEKSNTWHTAYGGGIILAPLNMVYADFNYGRSKKESTIQVRVTFFIP